MILKTTEDIIKNAILNRTLLNFFYINKWSNYSANRNVAPLALGRLKSGRLALRGMIMNNNSFSLLNGKSNNRYRTYLLSQIRITDDKQDIGGSSRTFNIPSDYVRGDKGMKSIKAQLSQMILTDEDFVEIIYEIK